MTEPPTRARLVIPYDGGVVVIRRWRPDVGHYAVLPGGGTGTGEEHTAERQSLRGTYEPAIVAVDVDELRAVGLRPDWLAERIPEWLNEAGRSTPRR